MMLQDSDVLFTPLDKVGEFGLVDRIAAGFPELKAPVVKGVGDDCAVFDWDTDMYGLLSTDTLAEGIHFDRSYTPLRHLGYKAIAVNASDVYAMNGEPVAVLVSLSVSSHYSVEQLEELYAGMRICCEEYDIQLIGGDTTGCRSGLVIGVTVLGRVGKSSIVYRSGASETELICVSGDLGSAYAGFQLLEREKRVWKENPDVQPDLQGYEYVLERQLKPEARRNVISALKGLEIVPTSMIDVSDGLASELHHLAKASHKGMVVYQDKVPIDPQTLLVAEELNLSGTTFALYGGEDYELLFTIKQADFSKLKGMSGISVIGHVQGKAPSVSLILADGSVSEVQPLGYNHFTS